MIEVERGHFGEAFFPNEPRPPKPKQKIKFKRPWLYPKQRKAIYEPVDGFGKPARYGLIEASTKTGKTTGCISWLTEKAYFAPKRDANYWWIAPIYPQAKIAYRRTRSWLRSSVVRANESELWIMLPNGARIWYKGSENPDSLYGEDVFAVVIDEASRAKEEAFHAVRSTLTATRGDFRAIGNVKGRRNWFFELCRRAEMGEHNMGYMRLIAADAVAEGILTAAEVEDARRILPEAVFRELYMAEPSDDAGNPFGYKYIAACIQPELSTKEPIVFGVDLAKSVDWTVITGLDEDGNVAVFERFQMPWGETMDRIAQVVGYVPTLVDSTGVGDPIVEQLQQRPGLSIEGYQFTAPSKQKLMEGLASAIQKHEVGVLDSHETPMRKELDIFEYEYTRTGVRYSAPEGYHDDCVCSLALAQQCKSSNNWLQEWKGL